MDIRMAGTVNDSIVDGPGIRLAIFVQGCTHHCKGCQNPQTWDPDGGSIMTTDHVIDAMKSNRLLKGITFSGGEPFEQPTPLIELAKACHSLGKDVWAYSGYTYEELESGKAGADARELLENCDVLVDGPFIESEKSMDLKWRGSRNQRLIDVPKSLETGSVVEYVYKWI